MANITCLINPYRFHCKRACTLENSRELQLNTINTLGYNFSKILSRTFCFFYQPRYIFILLTESVLLLS